ncbi:hypothetical protein QL285_094891 [Trifolium repens]|nr:hypothetical protein QL285_094891 [Trifolium repens]
MVSELVSIRLEPLIAFVVEFSKVWERVCFMYFMIDSVHVASAAKKRRKKIASWCRRRIAILQFWLMVVQLVCEIDVVSLVALPWL